MVKELIFQDYVVISSCACYTGTIPRFSAVKVNIDETHYTLF